MSHKKILLVDDNVDFLRTRSELLREAGYIVNTASSASEARDYIQHSDFDLAILDLKLEGNADDDFSGLKLAQEISPWLPKIILSRYPSVKAVREALKTGPEGFPTALDFVDKGGGMEALEPVIRRALGLNLAWLRSVQSTDEGLERDYKEAQGQARLMFILSMVFVIMGTLFLFLSLGIVITLLANRLQDLSWMTPTAGLLTAIGGVVCQAAGVLFFRRVDTANLRIEHYHDERLAGRRFEILLKACEDLGKQSEMGRANVVQAAAAGWLKGSYANKDETLNPPDYSNK
jgi:CheY-like chemotaxis protein